MMDRLKTLPPETDNPGGLEARVHVPADLRGSAPLVVVLHGCTQTAAGYDHGSGWSRLADRHRFALLFPQQTRANNPNGCFNWFQPGDTRRGEGEAASIAAQVEAMCAAHAIDQARIFVTGLSAGGAMAGTMCATYPELFAGGAIIAGLPYGCASSVGEAFACMSGKQGGSGGAAVRGASSHAGPWPRISVWHGTADTTVAPVNADRIVAQWTGVHGLPTAPTRTGAVGGAAHAVWAGPDGRVLVERYLIPGMGHGTPLRPGTGAGRSGVVGAHMIDAGISSTDHIAAFFGIGPAVAAVAPVVNVPSQKTGPQSIIEDALRKAGLMR